MEIAHNPGVTIASHEADIVMAFVRDMQKTIESDIGKLNQIQFTHKMIIFHGDKDARKFHRETMIKDLQHLNKQRMN